MSHPSFRVLQSLLGTSAVVLLAGCTTLGVDYSQPQLSLAHSYAQPGATGQAVTPETRWWTALGDKTLNGLVDEGLAQNLTVAQAIERIEAARATARINGVSYDPSVSASASTNTSGTFSSGDSAVT